MRLSRVGPVSGPTCICGQSFGLGAWIRSARWSITWSVAMRIDEILGKGQPTISFEFFPPKNEQGFAQLYQTIEDLKPLDPSYVSVTYGAGGGTRQKTVS